jgi:hypothetical protein
MKYLVTIILLLATLSTLAQAPANWEVSTLRIGPFKLNMPEQEAIELARKPLLRPSEESGYIGATTVKYYNELINVTLANDYSRDAPAYIVYGLSTTSSKFRTKSGMGVGSTKEELLATYKSFSHFEMRPGYDEVGHKKADESYFSVYDDDASSVLTFKIVKGKVVELSVLPAFEGC